MILKIRKRDGRIVRFNPDKISNAISKAFIALGKQNDNIDNITNLVLKRLDTKFKNKIPNVEDIQDEVENALIKLNYPDVAKSYILYRDERTKIRESNTRLMKTFYDIFQNENHKNKLTPYKTIIEYGLEGIKEFNKIFVLNPRHNKYHEEGLININKLEYLNSGLNDISINLTKVIESNDYIINNFLEFSSLVLNTVMNVKEEVVNSISFYNIENDLFKVVNKTFSKILKVNLNKYFNINKIDLEDDNLFNELTLSDNALENIVKNKGLEKHLDNLNKIKEFSIDETKIKFNETFRQLFYNLNSYIKDDYKIYFNIGRSNNNESLLVTEEFIKIIKDNFNNKENSFVVNYLVDVNNKNSLFYESLDLVNDNSSIRYIFNKDIYNGYIKINNNNLNENSFINISTTSINLARLSLQTKDYIKFIKLLDDTIDVVVEQLIEKRSLILSHHEDIYPTLINGQVWINKDILKKDAIKNSSLTIGLIGLKEAISYFNDEDFEILKHINDRIDKKNENLNINLSIAESYNIKSLNRLYKLDKDKYGVNEGLNDNENYHKTYLINDNDLTLFKDYLKYESNIQSLTKGGHLLEVIINKKLINKNFLLNVINLIGSSGIKIVKLTTL